MESSQVAKPPTMVEKSGDGVSADDVEAGTPIVGVAVVSFGGEHDIANRTIASLLYRLTQDNELVVDDFSSAKFIDSAMLSVVFEAEERARDLGKQFRIHLGIE